MSAVQGLWGRFGSAARGISGRAGGLQIGAWRERSRAAAPPVGGAEAGGRARSLLDRHVKAHGAVRDVLEICRSCIAHPDWLDGDHRHQRRDLVAEMRPVDMAAVLSEIPDRSLDLVFTVDAVEHVRMPWRVAAEIERILRPGGLTFHTTLFTTRYEPQPEDFFRFTPDGLKSLFAGLDCLTAEFDATARARSERRPAPGGDIFGGSREGWRVTYCGRKPALR